MNLTKNEWQLLMLALDICMEDYSGESKYERETLDQLKKLEKKLQKIKVNQKWGDDVQ